MAEVTITAQNPSVGRGDWGNKRFDKYYNRYLGELPLNKVSYDSLSTPERNVDELAQEVAAYLDPQLETTAKNLRRQTRQNYNTIDTEGAGRGMSRSTWVTDEKNAAYNAGMQGLADAYNSYNDALVSGVSERYENYLARKQALDQQNQKNQLETDKFNSQISTAQEQLAYERAAQAWARTKPRGSGRGSSSGGDGDEIPQKQGYYGTLTAGSTGSSSVSGARRNQVVRMTDGGGGGKSIKHPTSGSTKVQPVYKSSKKVSK